MCHTSTILINFWSLIVLLTGFFKGFLRYIWMSRKWWAESDKVRVAIFQLVQKRPIKGVKSGTKYIVIEWSSTIKLHDPTTGTPTTSSHFDICEMCTETTCFISLKSPHLISLSIHEFCKSLVSRIVHWKLRFFQHLKTERWS